MHHQNRVEGKYEAIIPVGIFNLVQQEIANHRKLDNPGKGDHLFLSRIRCRVCGVSYGPKVWHSNDKYCKEIWQCNNKYKSKGHPCNSPKFSEDEIIRGFEEISDEVFNSTDEEAQLTKLSCSSRN
jgi:hypothetical protein